jgi:predicted  nucleic acid-binding Zn-ribbon protein
MSILRESALEDRISTLLNQIEELKKTNEVANSSMRDIAKSALDSSAERKLSESLMNLNKNSESPVKGK